jgi:HEPN domain-containing protein
MSIGGEAWGHDLTALLGALPAGHRWPTELVDRAKALDKHYLPALYPNGFSEGIPRNHYTGRDAERAIEDAEAILEHCAGSIPG